MSKKLAFGIVALLIIVFGFIYIMVPSKEKVEAQIEYSEYAPDWVEDIEEEPDVLDSTVQINVVEATEGRGDFIGDHQRYMDIDGRVISLSQTGIYNGEIFGNTYYDEKGNARMRIWNEMNPNDGVIEGFALFKEEENDFVIYLFVDEDWKKQSQGNINIVWGVNASDSSTMKQQGFDFSQEKEGVYMMKISQDVSWFYNQNPIVGRMFFGEITKEEIMQDNFEGTFIMLV